MTPAQLAHLRLIDAHLAKLLSLAEKRTPGEWGSYENIGLKDTDIQRVGVTPKGIGSDVAALNMIGLSMDDCRCNAAFSASCAGNAEAGWKATRSMIDYLLMMHKHGDGFRYVGLTEDILTAFPLEMLKTTK